MGRTLAEAGHRQATLLPHLRTVGHTTHEQLPGPRYYDMEASDGPLGRRHIHGRAYSGKPTGEITLIGANLLPFRGTVPVSTMFSPLPRIDQPHLH